MVNRIKQIMEMCDSTPAQFATELGINRSNLTHVFSGRNQPSLDLTRKILETFPEIKAEWLIMGTGPMTKSDELKMIKEQINESAPNQPRDFLNKKEESDKSVEKVDNKIESPENSQVTVRTKEDNNTEQGSTKEKLERTSCPPLFKDHKKEVEKMILIYSDRTFETYYPQEK